MTKVKAIETTDGQIFKDIGAAQKHEIVILLDDDSGLVGEPVQRVNFAQWAVENGPALINILTMRPSSHPAARKANGATRKPRTVKPAMPTKPEAA